MNAHFKTTPTDVLYGGLLPDLAAAHAGRASADAEP